MDRDKMIFWGSIWIAIIVAIVIVVLSSLNFSITRDKLLINNGYTLQTIPGAACPVWTKLINEE